MADPLGPHACRGGPDLRRRPAVGERLAGAGRGRSGRHDDRPAGSIPQHARARRRRNRLETPNRAATTGSDPYHAGFLAVGADRKHDQPASRAGVARTAARFALRRPDQRRGRSAGHARSRPRLHQGQPDRADGDLDLLGPSRKRLARKERALALPPRRLSGIGAERSFPSAGLPRRGVRQRGRPRDRRPPAAIRAAGRTAGFPTPVPRARCGRQGGDPAAIRN